MSDNHGAVWILFMDTDGTVKSNQKISDTAGSFTGALDNKDMFGSSVTSIGRRRQRSGNVRLCVRATFCMLCTALYQ